MTEPTDVHTDKTPMWAFAPSPDEAVVAHIRDEWGLPDAVAWIAAGRLDRHPTDDERARLLRPSFRHLHDPYLLDGMHRATARLAEAVYAREPIVVFGDYDVDGTTATALLIESLKRLGATVDWRVPHRTTDGYGLTARGVDLVCKSPGTLVVLVDCGVTAVDEIALLREKGRETIVVDHHEPGERLPDAVAVLDPKLPGSTYPFDGLAAVGLAFKLLQALSDVLGLGPEEILLPGIDLVATGTAADIVPIRDENRPLMRLGLRRLERDPRPGLRALMRVAGLADTKLTTSSIVFGLAPRINAAGRMRSADTAVQLLLAQDPHESAELAAELDRYNRERRAMDRQVLDEARVVAAEHASKGANVLVLGHSDWHPGVVGIVAARLVEEFGLPTVMIALHEPVGKGSARSVPGFDMHAALGMCADELLGFGGHHMAAGVSISPDRLDAFRAKMDDVAQTRLTKEMRRPRIDVDAEAKLGEITLDFVRQLERLGPFGPGNMRPVLASRRVRAASPPRILKDTHLKLQLADGSVRRDAIAFGQAGSAGLFAGPVDVAYVAEENIWAGKTQLQLRIESIRPAE